MALSQTSAIGAGAIGYFVYGGASASPAPLDPATVPWFLATESQPAPPPRWRNHTLDSFVRGPELPQPTLDASTLPWHASHNSPEPHPFRRHTRESYARGPELPQPKLDPLTIQPLLIASTREQDVTPRWRYSTQDSLATVWFPSYIPAQQLNLINQGINHRRLGISSLGGGATGPLVFITGTNQSGTFAAFSGNIRRQLQGTGQCSVVFNVPAGGFVPQRGAAFVLSENGRTLFSGLIISRRWTVYPGTSTKRWEITGTDWNGLLQRHLVALNTKAGALSSIAATILQQPSILPDHIDTAGVDTTVDVGDAFSWSYIKMSDAFTQLSLSTATIWWIDNYKSLHQILPANAPVSVYALTENGQQADPDIWINDNDDNARNTQYVRTSLEILSESVTLTESHVFTSDPTDQVCPTSYPLTSAPQSVKENGVELIGTARLFQLHTDGTPTTYPSSGDGYYWAVNFFGIWHWPSNVPVTPGTTLAVTYTGVSTYSGNVVVYKNSADILARQAISGGSGILEEIEDYSGSITYSQALALAKGIADATVPPPVVIEFSTIEYVEDIGYAIDVNLPRWGVNEQFVVQTLQRTDMGADLGKGTRFRTKLQLVSARTLGNYPQYFMRLLARLNKEPQSAPTEKPVWNLAFDSPGNISAGLQPGTFGSPWDVKTGLGRILYVSAVFATGADANITIDITLNGISIFDSNKLQYTPAQTGQQILYGNLNPNQVNVKRGDLLVLSILATGNINPGKNGTVTVVIGQR